MVHFMGFNSEEDMPEELRAQLENERMHGEAYQHDLKHWIESMTEDSMKMLKSIAFQHSDRPSAAYLVGVINVTLENKFGICHACGKKHDDELTEMLGTPEADTSTPPKTPAKTSHAGAGIVKPDMTMSGPELLKWVPRSEQKQMDDYGVDFVEFKYPMVICSKCNTEYQSLADRMKRDPGVEGCGDCIQKAKWG